MARSRRTEPSADRAPDVGNDGEGPPRDCRPPGTVYDRGIGLTADGRPARLLRAASSAARCWMRCSSVIGCQRVDRRWPDRRIRPAASNARRAVSIWSRFPLARSASAEVVIAPCSESSSSSRPAATTSTDLRARERLGFARTRDSSGVGGELSPDATETTCPADCAAGGGPVPFLSLATGLPDFC